VPLNIIRGTMDVVGKAGKVIEGLTAAGKATVDEVSKRKVEEPERPE